LLPASALPILKMNSRDKCPVNRPRVLLADDNERLVERVAELLASSFDVVGIAHDGRELVSKALRLGPDVIVADITMPVLTGVEAIHHLREAGQPTRFVFLTIHNEDEFLQACLEEGAVGYVAKSHLKADLITAIHSALAGKQFISPSLSVAEQHR
jgi:DNA-binding NarL/FixJ family response regulator